MRNGENILWRFLGFLEAGAKLVSKTIGFLSSNFHPQSRLSIRLKWELDGARGKLWSGPLPTYDFCFEVSSEGEWQQVLPLVLESLKQGKGLQILGASQALHEVPSKLWEKYPEYRGKWNWMPLPLLSMGLEGMQIHQWVKAPLLFLCRYDFYPHLLLLKKRNQLKIILLNTSFKSRERWWRWPLKKWWDRQIFSLFDALVLSGREDHGRMQTLFAGYELPVHALGEFRSLVVWERLEKAQETLLAHGQGKLIFNWAQELKAKGIPLFILGNIWPVDLEILVSPKMKQFISQGARFLIVPHIVEPQMIEDLQKKLGQIGFDNKFEFVDKHTHNIIFNESKIGLCVGVKGILVELYKLGNMAFVGGGHGRSIHSVVEPFWAGLYILCGARTYRSTEWDQILGWDSTRIESVDHLCLWKGESFHPLDYPKALPPLALEDLKGAKELLNAMSGDFEVDQLKKIFHTN